MSTISIKQGIISLNFKIKIWKDHVLYYLKLSALKFFKNIQSENENKTKS